MISSILELSLALDERSAAITIDADGETWDVRLFAADNVAILFKSQNETELIAAINDVFRQWDAGIAGLVLATCGRAN
jgi:hypothetical protein